MDNSAINEWTRQLGRINYHAGRLHNAQDPVALCAMRNLADLLESAADSHNALSACASPPLGYFALPQSVPMRREIKSPKRGLGFTWAENLTPRDQPDNPFSPRDRVR